MGNKADDRRCFSFRKIGGNGGVHIAVRFVIYDILRAHIVELLCQKGGEVSLLVCARDGGCAILGLGVNFYITKKFIQYGTHN